MFKRVGIAARLDREDAVKLAGDVCHFLEENGVKTYLEPELASKVAREGTPLGEMKADLIVVIGGDGTVLRVLHSLSQKTPLLGIRMGTVGFLAEIESDQAFPGLKKVLNGDFIRDECMMLSNNLGLPDALNEVRLGTETPQQMIMLDVAIDGVKVASDRVDGLIVSTPTGSPGYALSAGAAVVDPRLQAMAIVPICPLSFNFRPIIVPSTQTVHIRPVRAKEVTVLIDGQFQKNLRPPSDLIVKRSSETVTFVRFRQNFYERLRRRLGTTSTPE